MPTFTTRQQADLYNSRKRVQREKLRTGVGFPDAVGGYTLPPANGANPSPVTAAEGLRAATFVWEMEHLGNGVLYPAGVLIASGSGLLVTFSNNALVTITATSSMFAVINIAAAPFGIPPTGLHTYVIHVDATDDEIMLLVDGKLVNRTIPAVNAWANGVTTWGFAQTLLNVGYVSDLHIFMDHHPPSVPQ